MDILYIETISNSFNQCSPSTRQDNNRSTLPHELSAILKKKHSLPSHFLTNSSSVRSTLGIIKFLASLPVSLFSCCVTEHDLLCGYRQCISKCYQSPISLSVRKYFPNIRMQGKRTTPHLIRVDIKDSLSFLRCKWDSPLPSAFPGELAQRCNITPDAEQ